MQARNCHWHSGACLYLNSMRFAGAWLRQQSKRLPEGIFLILLGFCAVFLVVQAIRKDEIRMPGFAWAPGYWEALPEAGLTRFVPIAGTKLVSPAAGSGASLIRRPLDDR